MKMSSKNPQGIPGGMMHEDRADDSSIEKSEA